VCPASFVGAEEFRPPRCTREALGERTRCRDVRSRRRLQPALGRRRGHCAIQETITAQFTKPPPSTAFRSLGRLRRTRNQIEYDDISAITTEDIDAEVETVRTIHATAKQLIDILPVFSD
jgi:hypothetical protein